MKEFSAQTWIVQILLTVIGLFFLTLGLSILGVVEFSPRTAFGLGVLVTGWRVLK